MTGAQEINFALISRGLLPLDGNCTCAACGATGLTRDDMADRTVYTIVDALEGHYNGPVCTTCADTARFCVDCDCLVGECTAEDNVGNPLCASCADEPDHAAQERHGWDQV
jgi:hypothetical protein